MVALYQFTLSALFQFLACVNKEASLLFWECTAWIYIFLLSQQNCFEYTSVMRLKLSMRNTSAIILLPSSWAWSPSGMLALLFKNGSETTWLTCPAFLFLLKFFQNAGSKLQSDASIPFMFHKGFCNNLLHDATQAYFLEKPIKTVLIDILWWFISDLLVTLSDYLKGLWKDHSV